VVAPILSIRRMQWPTAALQQDDRIQREMNADELRGGNT